MKTIRWKRWGVGAAGAVLAYALAGCWLLPQLIKSQVPKFVRTELERKATLGDVSFNPFSLRLEARDLRLTEANDAPLFAVGSLAVELDWRSLFRRAWSVAEIRITAPDLSLAIAADGKFNIAEFIATLERRPHDDSSSGMPRLIIASFVLEQGKVGMNDKRAGYADTFTPIAFSLHNLSTLPDENGDYTFSADAVHGGKLRWKGSTALNPISGSGVLALENVALPGLATYLKSYTRAVVTKGQLSANLPYRFSYKDGKFDASLSTASLALRDLGLTRDGAGAAFTTLKLFELSGVGADLGQRAVTIDGVNVDGGVVAVRRDARGEIDLANLTVAAPAKAVPMATAPATAAAPVAGNDSWKLHFKQIAFDDIAVNAVDESVSPALKLSAEKMQLHLQLKMETAASGLKLALDDAAFSLTNLALTSGSQAPLRLAQFGFSDGAVDLAARHASLGRLYADGGQLELLRDDKGQFSFMSRLPKFGADTPADAKQANAKPGATRPSPAKEAPWTASLKKVELNKFSARYEDGSSGIKAGLQDFNLKLDGVSNDLKQPIKFSAGLALLEGGQLSAQGKFVPSSAAVDATLQVKQLALAPVQPLLSTYLKLKIAGGSINAQGRLTTGAGGKSDPALRYTGSFEVAGLALNEEDNDRFASWKSVRADTLTVSLKPNLLDIAELRVVEPNATLIIENDRSFNAARLLVKPAAPAASPASGNTAANASANTTTNASIKTPDAGEPFPVRVRRLRFQNAKLDFTDLSLRPQFGAKIYELNGVVTGLSSRHDARSQIELDGRVDEYGQARVRGQLNPFVPADNTDMNVVFKNVDMVSASPYSMKFAGYKIAEGKISLDLQYKVRHNQLEGNNQIVLDKLTLGERIDSPDALKLPLALALAILKDSNGRIELGLPVSGDMNDPQFSYGAVVWKAVGNIMGRIVSSPFRALGNLFGVSGDKLESINFDPGSALVLPPEREKIKQVAQILAGKPQLTLSVPGQYSAAADGAALRMQALRLQVAARAGIKLEANESAGPLDLGQRKVRGALRDLYAERFGAAQLETEKKAAESAGGAAPSSAAADPGPATIPAGDPASPEQEKQKKLPVWQRLSKMVQGEPQVADASAFYGKLLARLEQSQALPAGALPQLGEQRALAILAALKEEGVGAACAAVAAAEQVDAVAGQPVALKLGLAARQGRE